MNRADTLALLSRHKPEMQRRFGVRSLALFGSHAREASHANSDFCDKALAYTQGLDRSTFAADSMRYDATLRNLGLIGEAATHVPDEVRKSNADVPWRMIVAARNRLIHGYLGIDDDTLWSIVNDDLVPLRAALARLLAAHPERR